MGVTELGDSGPGGYLMKLQKRYWPGLWSSESLTGAGGSIDKLSYSHGWEVDAAVSGRQASVHPHVGIFTKSWKYPWRGDRLPRS